jgi:hypothetical protein
MGSHGEGDHGWDKTQKLRMKFYSNPFAFEGKRCRFLVVTSTRISVIERILIW